MTTRRLIDVTIRFFPRARITQIHGQAKLVDGRIVVAMYNPAAALHREELRQTVIDDFTTALPAAIAEALERAETSTAAAGHAAARAQKAYAQLATRARLAEA